MPAAKPKLRDDVAVVELDGEAVIYDEASGNLHHLNPTATIVLAFCDGTSTISQFSREIAQAFDVVPTEVEPQVKNLVKEFRRAGLLERATSPKSNGSKGAAKSNGSKKKA